MGQEPAPSPRSNRARRTWGATGRLAVAVLAVAGHLAVLSVLIGTPPAPQKIYEPQTIPLDLTEAPAPRMRMQAPEPAPSSAAAPAALESLSRTTPAPSDVRPVPVSAGLSDDASVGLSEAQIAGAAAAGAGSGRACDMARRLQAALRRDPRVQAAVAEAGRVPGTPGQALFVWNGDWIRSRGQEGAGLAAVREAILWEVAFAPAACRSEPVQGLVLFSMADGAGAGRLVLGTDAWRWSDLLHPRAGGR